jgi:hypothetical protein
VIKLMESQLAKINKNAAQEFLRSQSRGAEPGN